MSLRIPKPGDVWEDTNDGRWYQVEAEGPLRGGEFTLISRPYSRYRGTVAIDYSTKVSELTKQGRIFYINPWPCQSGHWKLVGPTFICPECDQEKVWPEEESQYLCDDCAT